METLAICGCGWRGATEERILRSVSTLPLPVLSCPLCGLITGIIFINDDIVPADNSKEETLVLKLSLDKQGMSLKDLYPGLIYLGPVDTEE